MNWLEKLDKKFHGKGIPGITKVMLVFVLFGDLLCYIASQRTVTNTTYLAATFLNNLCFSPESIIHEGQVWRLFTWLLMPTDELSFWSILFMVCLWMLGNSLENYLGTFRMNVYFAMSWLISTVGGLLVYIIFSVSINLTAYYILFSLYLMLGLFFPEAEMRLYFVLPIKMKWLMLVYGVGMLYEIYDGFRYGYEHGLESCSTMILGVVSLLIFVFACKNRMSFKSTVKQKKRQRDYHNNFSAPRPGSGIGGHKCCICGRTSQTNPELTFRFCSKCQGNREYCQDHLFTHQHYRTM